MIRKDGHPFILDFGIAREIQETLTRVTGKLSSGTLLYMSPEQLNGAAPKKEQDIYSFAAMAYECLKGEPPFVRGAIEDQIKNKIPDPPPPTPPMADWAAEGRGCATMAPSVMAGLAKKPEDRPQTCTAVLEGGFSSAGAMARKEECGRQERAGYVLGNSTAKTKWDAEGQKSVFAKILAVLALSALLAVGALWMAGGSGGKSSPPQIRAARPATVPATEPSLAQPPPLQESRKHSMEESKKKEAVEIRIEAKVWQGKIARISGSDGFEKRKNALADLFARAEANFDDKVKNWGEAAQGFANYVAQCEALEKLDGERLSAIAARDKAAESRRGADDANAKEHAGIRWREAEGLMDKARSEFRKMRFAASGAAFASAAEQFVQCVQDANAERARRDEEARKERERQERLEKEKRERAEKEAQAERAKQARSIVGKWRGSQKKMTSSEITSKWPTKFWQRNNQSQVQSQSEFTIDFEYDFKHDGTYCSSSSSSSWSSSSNGSTTSRSNSKSTNSQSGDWILSGNRLTLHPTKSQTVGQTFINGKASSFADRKVPDKHSYVFLQRPDGTLELRVDIDEIIKKLEKYNYNVDARYKPDGTLIMHMHSETHNEGYDCTSSSTDTTTPRILKRVSD